MDLTTFGLPKGLTDKMEAAQRACAEPCPTCGVGRGRWCDHRVENVRRQRATLEFRIRVHEATIQHSRDKARVAEARRLLEADRAALAALG